MSYDYKYSIQVIKHPTTEQRYVGVLDSSGWQFNYAGNGKMKPGARNADFTPAAARGVAGIIHRIGNGTQFDESFPMAYAAAKVPRIPFGAYYYAQPNRLSAKEAAALVNKWLGPYETDIPFMLDWEEYYGDALSKQAVAAWINEFIALTNGILYAGNAFLNTKTSNLLHPSTDTIQPRYPRHGQVPPSNLTLWPAWIPWNKEPQPNNVIGNWEGWQFSSDGNARGFGYPTDAATSRLDLNVVTVEAWDRWLARANVSSPAPVPPVGLTPVVQPPTPPVPTFAIETLGPDRYLAPNIRIGDTRGRQQSTTLFAIPLPKLPGTPRVVDVTVTAIPDATARGYLSQDGVSFLNYFNGGVAVANTTRLKVYPDDKTGINYLYIAASTPVHVIVDLIGYNERIV